MTDDRKITTIRIPADLRRELLHLIADGWIESIQSAAVAGLWRAVEEAHEIRGTSPGELPPASIVRWEGRGE